MERLGRAINAPLVMGSSEGGVAPNEPARPQSTGLIYRARLAARAESAVGIFDMTRVRIESDWGEDRKSDFGAAGPLMTRSRHQRAGGSTPAAPI